MIKLSPERKDKALRTIRDSLYAKCPSKNTSDANWEACKEGWEKTFSDIHDALREKGFVIELREMKADEL